MHHQVTTGRLTMAVILSAAAVAVALMFFVSSVLLMQPWFAMIVAQTRVGLEPLALSFAFGAIGLSLIAFFSSWKQKSSLIAALLLTTGMLILIHPLSTITMHSQMQRAQSAMMNMGFGPVFVILGSLATIGLGVAKVIGSLRK